MGSIPPLAVLILGLIMSRYTITVSSVLDTAVTSVLCNSGVYTSGDPFATSLGYTLEELEKVTSTTKGYDYRNISPYPNAFVYGHAACKQTLTSSDCTTCLAATKSAIQSSCPKRIGARVVLRDCTIRYEQYPFND